MAWHVADEFLGLIKVADALNVKEIWYFGLFFVDTKEVGAWIKMSKKILSQDIRHDSKVRSLARSAQCLLFAHTVLWCAVQCACLLAGNLTTLTHFARLHRSLSSSTLSSSTTLKMLSRS